MAQAKATCEQQPTTSCFIVLSSLHGHIDSSHRFATLVRLPTYSPVCVHIYRYLEFYSAFFEGKKRSPTVTNEERKPPSECPDNTTQQHWDFVTSIRPLIPDQEYLESEALLVVVRSEDTNEALGEGRFSLFGVDGISADTPKHFSTELSHGGLHTGFLAGKVRIKDAISNSSGLYAEDEEDETVAAASDASATSYVVMSRDRGEGGQTSMMRRPRAEVVQSVRIKPPLPPKVASRRSSTTLDNEETVVPGISAWCVARRPLLARLTPFHQPHGLRFTPHHIH